LSSLNDAWLSTEENRVLPWALAVYEALGAEPVGPFSSSEAHPLFTALWRDQEGPVGLLHWPTPDELASAPVVRPAGPRLEAVAQSLRDATRQGLAALEQRGVAVQQRWPDLPSWLWTPGERVSSPLPDDAWILSRAGGTPSAFRGLLARHLGRGDTTAALVVTELWGERFAGWGAPHAARAQLLSELGRHDAARDAAIHALGLPLWTLDEPFEPVAIRAGWKAPIDAQPYARLAADPAKLPADRAAWLLDWASATGTPWSKVLGQLRMLYGEAGLTRTSSMLDARSVSRDVG
jgi:hypothetical protein